MKKRDIVRSAKKGWPDVIDMVNHIFRDINKALVEKESVTIYNFGKFEIVESKVKEVYDFQTKRRMRMPRKLKVKFHLSPKISKILNERNRVDNVEPRTTTK